MVDEAVDHGGGHDRVTEDFSPPSERLVGGDDDRCSFVAGRYQLEEQVGGFGFERDIAHLVDDEEGDAPQAGEFCLETSSGVGFGETAHPFGSGGESHPMSGLAGSDAQADSQMSFPGSGWPQEHDVFSAGDKVESS